MPLITLLVVLFSLVVCKRVDSQICCDNLSPCSPEGIAMKPLTPKAKLPSSTRLRKAVFRVAPKKAALLLLTVALLLAGGAAAVRGQSALDGFDPNANSLIQTVVVQPDGKILIGGSFTSILGVTRNRIARLNADGTLDTAFNPNANGDVYTIAVQADGKILAGGFFFGANSIGGQPRDFIARLDAVTGAADSWNPTASSAVRSIAVQTGGQILAGGSFTSIGGQPRMRIARLDPVTGLADSFNPSANATVFSIAVQADGKILAGGQFSNIGGQTRFRIARLDAVTGAADSFSPNPNDIVNSIVVQRTARFWQAALSSPLTDRRAITSPGLMR